MLIIKISTRNASCTCRDAAVVEAKQKEKVSAVDRTEAPREQLTSGMANSSDKDSLSLSIHSAGAGCLGSRPPNHNSIRSPLCKASRGHVNSRRLNREVKAKATYSTTTSDHSNDETLVALLLGGGEALGGSAFEH